MYPDRRDRESSHIDLYHTMGNIYFYYIIWICLSLHHIILFLCYEYNSPVSLPHFAVIFISYVLNLVFRFKVTGNIYKYLYLSTVNKISLSKIQFYLFISFWLFVCCIVFWYLVSKPIPQLQKNHILAGLRKFGENTTTIPS